MKARWTFLALALALAATGSLFAFVASGPVVQNEAIVSSQPRHPVTAAMEEFVASMNRKPAPSFVKPDTKGEPVRIAPKDGERPQFVYFIMDGCPCSYEVEPLFQALRKRYAGKVEFVGVMDQGPDKARRWRTELAVDNPVVPDPKLEVISQFGATNSAFSALVSRDGKIIKMWPGYSKDILQEMNGRMATEIGLKATPFDTKWAPEKRAAGCVFEKR